MKRAIIFNFANMASFRHGRIYGQGGGAVSAINKRFLYRVKQIAINKKSNKFSQKELKSNFNSTSGIHNCIRLRRFVGMAFNLSTLIE